MMISGLVAQIAVVTIVGLISVLSGGDERFNGPIAEIIIPAACFGLVGLPLLGFLFSRSYSATEPTVNAERAVTPKGT